VSTSTGTVNSRLPTKELSDAGSQVGSTLTQPQLALPVTSAERISLASPANSPKMEKLLSRCRSRPTSAEALPKVRELKMQLSSRDGSRS
jgi:hypothetical protein